MRAKIYRRLKRIFPEPYIIKEAIEFLDGVLRPKHIVFEWGSGSSTIWLAERCKRVVTVEHDLAWADLVERSAAERGLKVLLHLVHPYDAQVYADTILGYDQLWDLIFIDGPSADRMLCVEYAIERVAPGGLLLFDNSNIDHEAVQLIDAQGWQGTRFEGEFFLDDVLMGVGETTIWQRPR